MTKFDGERNYKANYKAIYGNIVCERFFDKFITGPVIKKTPYYLMYIHEEILNTWP